MRLGVEAYTDKDVRVSFEAENQAEEIQIKWLFEKVRLLGGDAISVRGRSIELVIQKEI